ncbi:hypothetical protein [Pseudomonas phage D6]|nr:hypothetical protein [Pseudomonas phage D6]
MTGSNVVSVCARNFSRDKGLVAADWRKFFESNQWVYLAHKDSPVDVVSEARNAKAYITNVKFNDHGFDFDLNLLDGWTEDDHLDYTIEPVYAMQFRQGKPIGAVIQYLEFVPTE